MNVESVRPSSWTELLEALFAESWNAKLGRFRSPYAFRGQPVASEDLSSRLLRLAAGRAGVARLELHLLRNFRKYAFRRGAADSIWHWLALGRHRGLPTRLLDGTYSPFVALHCATDSLNHMNEHGVVWAINFVEANRFFPDRLKRLMTTEGLDTATVEMLWLAAHAKLARRVIVPVALKWDVRDKLDQANVNVRVLFPGLDGLSRWLTRYYWPKPVASKTLRQRKPKKAVTRRAR